MENDREQERGKSVMEKKYLFMTGIAVSAALWCRQRNKKYSLAAGYPLLNKFIIPESFLSCHIMRIANRQLAAMKQPSPPRGIKRMRKRIDSGKERREDTAYRLQAGIREKYAALPGILSWRRILSGRCPIYS